MQDGVDERILRVRELVKDKRYRLSGHAEKEREDDHITQNGLPIHYVLTLAVKEILFVITVYRPDPEQWVDSKVRKR